MKRRIFSIILTLTALALALLLGFTFYENQLLKEDAQNYTKQRRASMHQIEEMNNALEEQETSITDHKTSIADKDAYIEGQNAYIEELTAQLQELMNQGQRDEETDASGSSYAKDYPELYSQREYDLRNGTRTETGKKTVYLTFDDGPSDLTPQVLDLLDQYQAKATFFVVYKENKRYTQYLSEIVRRGHTLALHSYSHDYKKIYASTEAFLADYDKVYAWVYEETGQRPALYRFPGGSTNAKKASASGIKAEMARRGFSYYDWNVSSGDGSNLTTTENIIDNICSNVENFSFPVVLMHDGPGKEATLAALPTVLENLKNMGYSFESLNEHMEPIQF